MKQQSFKNERASLYLVATPIGNLDEFSLRAQTILNEVDVIASEDTRHSKKLCLHFDIKTPMISYHEHNEADSSKGILDLLKKGQNVALISDAGYPCLCDPGYVLVNLCIENGFNVIPVSGSNAALNALVASGLPPYPHVFIGFLPHKTNARLLILQKYAKMDLTVVFYESVHRIESTLSLILQHLGDRKICLARELTKRNEEFIRGNVSTVLEQLETLKGEFVVCLEAMPNEIETLSDKQLCELVDAQINLGLALKQATKQVAIQTGYPKNTLYELYIKNTQ